MTDSPDISCKPLTNCPLRITLLGVFFFVLAALPCSAERFGRFTYSVTDENTVTITDYPEGATGEVVIPAEIGGRPVTRIGREAFLRCRSVTSMAIPDSVTSIEWRAFGGSGLTSIEVAAGNPHFRSVEGVLFNSDQSSLIQFPAGRSGAYSIPDSVISISGAFYGCSGLTSVTIPDSVTSIGHSAFAGCSDLTSVMIPDSVTSIGHSAFASCSGLTSVMIPDSVTAIGYVSFAGCSGLTSVAIPDSVTSIGDAAFHSCSSLTSVMIPDSVTSITGSAFSGCSGLTSVTIPDSVTSIGSSAFSGCSGLASVTIPDSVTSIGSSAFSGCSGLASVTIPDSVTSIDFSVFFGCSGLTSIEVAAGNPAYSSVEGVFFNTGQTSLIQFPAGRSGAYSIPDSVTSIGWGAFSGCSGLTSVTIPDSVTEIGSSAFSGCSGLTSVAIPDSVTSIGRWTFAGCSGLASVSIGNSVTSIGREAFQDCSGLTSVTIGASVTSIASEAFSGCISLTSIGVVMGNPRFSSVGGVLFNTDQTSLIQFPAGRSGAYSIPDSVISISGAFSDCSGLTSVTIPDSVSRIYDFQDCISLTSILFLGDAPIASVPFRGTSENLTVFYLSGSTGFGLFWNYAPTVMLDRASDFAVPSWLLAQDLPHDTDLAQDLSGDGYPLLTAYALDLDPSVNLASRMPIPELGEGTMAMSFHGEAQGIRYTVETSTDLQTWTTEGVTLSEPNADGMRLASVERDSPTRYLRLRVELE